VPTEAIACAAIVGMSLVAGAVAGTRLRLGPAAAAAVTAFGGGLLLSAVALELVPDADASAGTAVTALGLLGGTAVFVVADWRLHRDPEMSAARNAMHAAMSGRMTSRVQQGRSLAAGLVIDGVPESLALGLTIADERLGLALLAGVVVGNLVESYAGARLIGAGALRLFSGIAVALAIATVAGGTVLAGASETLVGGAQAVAAGAVLAVVSITVIPETFRDLQREVAVALIAGFVAGYLLS
jgi:zinc transporter, ZIP family